MPRRILLCLVSCLSISAFAVEVDVSAERQADQSWEAALQRVVSEQKIHPEPANAVEVSEFSPRQAGGIPEWDGDLTALEIFFAEAGGIRNYDNPNAGDFQRKAAWLYVNDGCYAKAAHVSSVARSKGLLQPGKIYAFGNLIFRSPYARNGRAAYWTYHIAAAYRMGSTVYVLDPAVSPGKVVTEEQWKSLISPDPDGLRISHCDSHSYSPYSTCVGGNGNGAYVGSMPQFLQLEWSNLIQLGYSPNMLLGPFRKD